MEATSTNDARPKLFVKSAGEVLDRPFGEMVKGDRFTTRGRTITEADVVSFAALTGDWHPQHTDAVFSEASVFGARVAHGLLAVAYSIGLVPNHYVLALRRLKHVVFKNPVHFGDTIHVEGEVIDLRDVSDQAGLVTGRWRIANQKDQTVFRMDLEALWRRDRL